MTRSPFTGRYGLAAVLPVAAFGLLGIAGCGGHHNSSDNTAATITATIDWPARSRDITNVSTGAVAAIITAESGDPNNGDDPIDFAPIIRGSAPTGSSNGAFNYPWTSPSTINYGTRTFQIRFYNALPTGTVNGVDNSTLAANYASIPSVGDATVTITVSKTSFDLGAVTVSGTIGSLSLASTTVNFGNTAALGATALATDGKTTIALTDGSIFYSAPTNPYFTLDQAGDVGATGLGGPVTVTAKVYSGGPTSLTIPTGTDVSTTASISTIVGFAQLVTLPSGLLGRDTVVGTGTAAAAGTPVTITYTGYYSTAPVTGSDTGADTGLDSGSYATFDTAYATTGRSLTIGDGTLPAILDQAVTGMQSGGTRIVVIPPAQATGISLPSAAPAGAYSIYTITRSN